MPGNDDPPTEPSNGPPVAPDEPAPLSGVLWLVSFDDNDDREMRAPEIAAAIAKGDIDAETIVWREGLSGWLPIAEVPALAQLLPSSGDTRGAPPVGAIFVGGNGQRARRSDAPPLPPARKSKPPPGVEEGKSQPAEESKPAAAAEASKPEPPAEESKPAVAAEASKPEPSTDDEAEPQSLDPESLSAESLRALADASQGSGDAKALSAGTFGMSAADESKAEGPLGRRPPPPPLKPPKKKSEEQLEEIEPAPSSGTPSLSALAALAPDDKDAKLDELMTVNAAALPGARPAPLVDVSTLGTEAVHDNVEPPPSSYPPPAARTPTKKSHRAAPAQAAPAAAPASGAPQLLIASIVGGIIAGGAVFLAVKTQAPPAPVPPPPQNVPAAAPTPPTTPAATPLTPPSLAPTNLPPPTAATAAPPAPTTAPTPAPTAKAPAVAAPTTQRPAPTPAAPKPTATAAATAAPTAPPTAAATASAAPAATAAATEPAAAPFDKAAAAAALSAAAGRASACRKEGDPTGQAIVRVTFSNSGKATQALLEGPPFAGTATGGCIAAAMRTASVPAYSGDRVTVSKTVTIN